MKRDGSPTPVTQKQLLQFEAEFGCYVKVPRMTLESPDGQMRIPGGFYLSQCLHQLRICDGFLLQPPTDARAIYLFRKLFMKCSAMESQARYEQAKSKLISSCVANLVKPNVKQLAFVKALKLEAEIAMNAYQDFLKPEVEKQERIQRHKNDKRYALKDVKEAVDALLESV